MTITTLPLDAILASSSTDEFPQRRALSDVSSKIARCRKAVVISGAGISCSSGIPDFRSSSGLYNLVKERYPEVFVTGKDLFSSGLFTNPQTTSLFYTFIAELATQCNGAQPTPTHHFISRLATKGKLLRSYTQNIDGLERRIGLESGGRGTGYKKKTTQNVELHGDIGRVRCVLCMKDFEARAEWMAMFLRGDAPGCPECEHRCSSRVSRKARALPVGTLRPSIVLYDEPHPLGEEIGNLQAYDLGRSPDILLVMGTSLKVHGLKKVVKAFAKAVHARDGKVIFVNATPPSKQWEGVIDIHVQGETDKWVQRVEEEWRHMRPQDWETQTVLDQELSVIKEVSKKLAKAVKPNTKTLPLKPRKAVPMQLPTPRASKSPSRASSPIPNREDDSKQCPPTPLSPSKRPANMPLSPESHPSASPKRQRSVHGVSPFIADAASQKRGNLFANVVPPKSQDLDAASKSVKSKTKPQPKAIKSNSRIRADKENEDPKQIERKSERVKGKRLAKS